MKITFFIKKAPKRDDLISTATIYVRLHDTHARDTLSTMPLSINPNKWDAKNECVKLKAVMDEELRSNINKQLAEFRLFLTRKYMEEKELWYDGWLKDSMRSFFGITENTRESSPEKYKSAEPFFKLYDKFVTQKDIGKTSKQHYLSLRERLLRFELYMREVKGNRLFRLNIHTFSVDDFLEFSDYVINEYNLTKMYHKLFEAVPFSKYCKPRPMGVNSMIGSQHRLHSFLKWCYSHQLTTNHSYMLFDIKMRNYGTPYFLTKEERDTLAAFDFSETAFPEKYDMECDTFIFQCLVGCRISNIIRLLWENIQKAADGEKCMHITTKNTKRRVAAEIRTGRNLCRDVLQFQLTRVAVFAAPLCGQNYIVMRSRLHNYVTLAATLCSSGYITMWFQLPLYAVSAALCCGFNHAKMSFQCGCKENLGGLHVIGKDFLILQLLIKNRLLM